MSSSGSASQVLVLPPFRLRTRMDGRSGFECEHEELNRFFRESAGQNNEADVNRTWVLPRPEERPDLPPVLGFYTLALCVVSSDSFRQVTRSKRMPSYPAFPAVLIGRLARHRLVRGLCIGESLLGDAHLRAMEISRQGGGVAVIVDAKDEHAQAFYSKYGYELLPDQQVWPRKMLIAMKVLLAAEQQDF
ncbi:hypothetical protein [Corallococcus exiguus]|uniref:hypothetical protein n=1 Tax=Corallococcus exiguus TaxID=83462 RepID=UPI0015609099|nr:hypothetical protein [Corallococcus exiguus]NRD55821.1 hypothetical protein [Corallococcus exiguus]